MITIRKTTPLTEQGDVINTIDISSRRKAVEPPVMTPEVKRHNGSITVEMLPPKTKRAMKSDSILLDFEQTGRTLNGNKTVENQRKSPIDPPTTPSQYQESIESDPIQDLRAILYITHNTSIEEVMDNIRPHLKDHLKRISKDMGVMERV